ncbi:MAG: hypothetical protein ACT4N4_11085 [Rhodospirillales bacterium]
MRVAATLIAVLAVLAVSTPAWAGCSPAHTVELGTPAASTAAAPQSTPAPAKPGG